MPSLGGFDSYLLSALDGVALGMLYFTLAAGLALVFGMMDVLNLAHGLLYLAGAYVAYRYADGGWSGLLLALAVGALLGAAGGVLLAVLTRPLTQRGHLDQAVLTLGIALVGVEIFMIASGGEHLPAAPPEALAATIAMGEHTYPAYRLVFIGVAGLLAVGIHLVFVRSRMGALVRATVADRDMVRALGVNPWAVTVGVFAVGSLLAVVGGVLGAPILGPGPGVDEDVLVMALVVVVVGGLTSVRGVLLAALLVGQLETIGRALVPELAAFLVFAAMFLTLVLRPTGLGAPVRAT